MERIGGLTDSSFVCFMHRDCFFLKADFECHIVLESLLEPDFYLYSAECFDYFYSTVKPGK